MSPLIGFQGQYPGGPMKRKPTGGRDFLQPREFKFISHDIRSYIDLANYDISGLPLTPGWTLQRLQKDFLRELYEAQANPAEDFSTQQLEEFGGEAGERGIQGAFGLELDWDPAKWAKDPVEMAKKTMKGWARKGLDPQDIEQRVYRELWEEAIGRKSVITTATGVTGGATQGALAQKISQKLDEATTSAKGLALKSIEQRPFVRSLSAIGISAADLEADPANPTGKDLLNLSGFGITRENELAGEKLTIGMGPTGQIEAAGQVVTEDVYDAYGANVIKWKMVSGGTGTRDRSYTDLIQSANIAISADFQHQIDKHGDIDTFLKASLPQGILSDNDAYNNVREGILSFQERTKLAELIENAETTSAKKVSNGVTKYLQEPGGRDTVKIADSVRKDADSYKADLQLARNQIQKVKKTMTAGVERDQFVTLMDGYEKTINEVENMLNSQEFNDLLTRIEKGGVDGQLAAHTLKSKFDGMRNGNLFGKSITGGDPLVASYHRALNQQLFEQELLLGNVGKTKSQKNIGRIIHDMDARSTYRMKRLMVIGSDAAYDRIAGISDELLRNFEKENLSSYLWSKARTRLGGFTPAFYANAFMTKCLYFGLVEDTSRSPLKPYKWAEKLFRGKWSEHRFDLNLEGITGGTLLLKGIQGGSHLKAAGQLYSSWAGSKDINDDALVLLLNYDKFKGKKFKSLADALKDHDFASELFKRNGNKQVKLPVSKDEIQKFSDDFQKFKNWMSATFAKEGRVEQASGQLAMVKKLGEYNASFDTYKIANSHLGLLQKLAVKLNKLQTFILKKFKRIIEPVAYLSIAIKEFIQRILIRLAIKFIPGVGQLILIGEHIPIVGKIIGRVIQAATQKVINLGTSFIKGILTFNMSGFKKQIDGFFSAATKFAAKTFMVACGCCLAPLLLGALIITGVFVGATPPTSPAKNAVTSFAVPIINPEPSIENKGSCPLIDGRVFTKTSGRLNGSYRGALADGHGSNDYWDGLEGTTPCSYGMPAVIFPSVRGPSSSSEAASYCYNPGNENGQYYGYAADFVSQYSSAPFNLNVYAPELGNTNPSGNIEWVHDSTTNSTRGSRMILRRTDPTDGTAYALLILHLGGYVTPSETDADGRRIFYGGDHIGTMFTGWSGGGNVHIHVEMTINNSPAKPEHVLDCNWTP